MMQAQAYRNGNELKGDIANGDIDGIQDRKRSENDIFTLSQAGRDLLLALYRSIDLQMRPSPKQSNNLRILIKRVDRLMSRISAAEHHGPSQLNLRMGMGS